MTTSFRDKDVWYKYHDIKTSWRHAKRLCERDNGRMAVINTKQTLETLQNFLNYAQGLKPDKWVWLGARNLNSSDNEWFWVWTLHHITNIIIIIIFIIFIIVFLPIYSSPDFENKSPFASPPWSGVFSLFFFQICRILWVIIPKNTQTFSEFLEFLLWFTGK